MPGLERGPPGGSPRSPDQDHDPARRILVATPGFEGALMDELRGPGTVPDAAPADLTGGPWPGIVCVAEPTSGASPPLDPIFARQQLPAAFAARGSSVAALAELAYQAAEATVDASPGPFTIHAFSPTGGELGLGSRVELIASELLSRLRQRRRRAARRYVPPAEAALAFDEIRVLVQLALVARDRAFVSVAQPRALETGGWDLAPWPGGIAPILDDRQPPSRAYRKLEEAFRWMAAEPRPGELCVDLGGAPGGWSYTALRRDARVIAVDRAPLSAPVRNHPHLTMIEGNAFTYQPPPEHVPVDWLLSDVICEPARALGQLDRWLRQGWCRRLVMTVKFKGSSGYGMLADVRQCLIAAGCPRWRIKHLHHNKNEVTIMAESLVARRE